MTPFVTAGAGFLLAVLWFDLMFDVQVLRHRRAPELPAQVIASISAYYGRVTTTARPMNRLIGLVMLGTLAALVAQIVRDDAPDWAAWAALGLAAGPIGLAATHTFPAAVRLGRGSDPPPALSGLARSICRDHLAAIAGVGSLMVIELAWA